MHTTAWSSFLHRYFQVIPGGSRIGTAGGTGGATAASTMMMKLICWAKCLLIKSINWKTANQPVCRVYLISNCCISGLQKKGNGIPRCRGNASKAKEGQGSLEFQSIHPALLNDHYHDNIECCSSHSLDHLDQLLEIILFRSSSSCISLHSLSRLLGKLLLCEVKKQRRFVTTFCS